MRALIKTAFGPGRVELAERATPTPGPGYVLVKVAYCAVSSSDLHVLDDIASCFPPVVIGQQFSGTIESWGEGVEGFAVGQAVMGEMHGRVCGRCRFCRTGRYAYCPDKRAIGIGVDGAMADFVTVPTQHLHIVPKSVGLREAALVEPAAVCLAALTQRTGLEPGDHVVVIGCNFNALVTIQLARALGAGPILVGGLPSDEEVRIPLACDLGASEAGILQRVDLADLVMDWTEGAGADLVLDFLGHAGMIEETTAMLRTEGRYCVVGFAETADAALPWRRLYQRAVSVFFHYSSNFAACEQALRFAADGRLRLAPLITDEFVPEDWASAFAFARGVEAVKVLIRWN